MRLWLGAVAAAVALSAAPVLRAQIRQPYQVLDDEPDNVYLQPATPLPDQLTNQGGAHFSFDVDYFSTYMYRGVDQSTPPKHNEKALQFDGRLDFDLGKLPHPFVGVFSNIFNSDRVSRFEEVRPYAGADWTIRPITLGGGFNGYIYPIAKASIRRRFSPASRWMIPAFSTPTARFSPRMSMARTTWTSTRAFIWKPASGTIL